MVKLTSTAETVLKARYYRSNETEWKHLAKRVSSFFAKTEEEEKSFYDMLKSMDALPNSPCLMNADTKITSYSACFVLPIEDNIESIFKYYTDAGIISKSGGGVGANFSNIRPAGSSVGSTGGVASGPISFMEGQNALTEVIKQGGKRRGANMGILDCHHEDILQFVKAKDTPGVLENFNLSVRVTDEFMQNVTGNSGVGTPREQVDKNCKLWDEIVQRAWSSGEPGIIFGDTIERGNTTPHLGKLNQTNPCGEQPLLPYESCSLIAINLSNHIAKTTEGTIVTDWVKLSQTVSTAVLFMNRVLDKSKFPIKECQEAMDKTRKIGVGIMGLHDMLIQLKIPYDSVDGRIAAARAVSVIASQADQASKEISEKEGTYSGYATRSPDRRNACLTTIAPTGTLSMIADCSSGCEPYYSPITYKTVLDNTEFKMHNKWLGKLQIEGEDIEDTLKRYSNLFKGAEDIHWSDHIRMQASLQEYIDSSISKTINMPSDSTIQDVKDAYELGWKLKCKGLTIYRDGSRDTQILSKESESEKTHIPVEVDRIKITEPPTPWKLELPDEIEAKRYRIVDNKGKKAYVTIGLMDGIDPVEVFMTHPYERTNSYLSAISRLVSLCLRFSIPLKEVCKQLQKSSTSVADVLAKLARILDKYQSQGEWMDGVSSPCPECGNSLTPESGCWVCKHCGYSKCL